MSRENQSILLRKKWLFVSVDAKVSMYKTANTKMYTGN